MPDKEEALAPMALTLDKASVDFVLCDGDGTLQQDCRNSVPLPQPAQAHGKDLSKTAMARGKIGRFVANSSVYKVTRKAVEAVFGDVIAQGIARDPAAKVIDLGVVSDEQRMKMVNLKYRFSVENVQPEYRKEMLAEARAFMQIFIKKAGMRKARAFTADEKRLWNKVNQDFTRVGLHVPMVVDGNRKMVTVGTLINKTLEIKLDKYMVKNHDC
jgi:hypothetical protein